MNEYNNFPMRPLNRLSPNEYLAFFFSKQSLTNVWQAYKCIFIYQLRDFEKTDEI